MPFQFLIGRLATAFEDAWQEAPAEFQFLIGRLATDTVAIIVSFAVSFLIGRLATHHPALQQGFCRFQFLQVGWQRGPVHYRGQRVGFQFLIGRLATFGGAVCGGSYGGSIPHR